MNMKIKTFVIVFLAFCYTASAQKLVLKNATDSLSYAMGVTFGQNVQAAGIKDINGKLFADAIQSVLQGKMSMTYEDASIIINTYFATMQKTQSEKNLKEGQAFLSANRTKPGVVTLPSGLQYKIIKEGNGPKPLATSDVTVHYHGTLINGTVFDSSVERGSPVELAVNRVIQGWQDALQLMPVGSKWILYIPADLGYGASATGPIEPNSTLIFEVELISIN